MWVKAGGEGKMKPVVKLFRYLITFLLLTGKREELIIQNGASGLEAVLCRQSSVDLTRRNSCGKPSPLPVE